MKTKKFLVLALLTILALVVSACAPAAGVPGAAPAAPAGEESAVSGDEYSTPHPILSDLRVRTALAQCLDKDALIASVYPYVEDATTLEMDSFNPKTHWAWQGPYDFPSYDPAAAAALLDEAGWTLAEGAAVRTNADGEALSLKFTTTNAQFRQTWSAVAIQQWAECGIQIIPYLRPWLLVVWRHDGPGPPRLRTGRLRLGRPGRPGRPHALRLQPGSGPRQQLGRPELHGLVQ
jgi:ABC-type transport system substrate-binding protein